MAFGERIRLFRQRKELTQKELGKAMGYSERTADIRVAQYESEKRTPKAETIKSLSAIFDVAPEAITVPDIDSYYGLMHTLFALEDKYGLTITELDGQVCLKQDINHPKYDLTLRDDLSSWSRIKTRLTTGSITREAYDHWRYSFPADRAAEAKTEMDEMRRNTKKEKKRI